MQGADRSVDVEPRSRTNDEFLAGDGLRAAAALSVLAFHTIELVVRKQFGGSYAAAFGAVPGRVLMSLNDGLYIFFVLSGYLLARGFARAIVEGRPTPSLRRYGVSRLLRIVPAFWLAVTVTLLLRGTAGADLGHVLALYGFAQVYSLHIVNTEIIQAWTLDIEMGFYILLPLGFLAAARWARRRPTPAARAVALLVPLAVIAAASWALALAENPSTLNANPPEFLFAFTPGIALAVVEPLLNGRMRPRRARIVIGVLLAAGAALFAVSCTLPQFAIDQRGAVAAAGAGCLVAAALVRQWTGGRSWRLLANPLAHWLGERSYGIYLFHWLVMLEVAGLAAHGRLRAVVLTTGATLVLSVAAAALSWRFVERPALRLRRRLVGRRPAPKPALAELPA
jgi:peptidoglycan/LPS O-acetylase OafA/YrhL